MVDLMYVVCGSVEILCYEYYFCFILDFIKIVFFNYVKINGLYYIKENYI